MFITHMLHDATKSDVRIRPSLRHSSCPKTTRPHVHNSKLHDVTRARFLPIFTARRICIAYAWRGIWYMLSLDVCPFGTDRYCIETANRIMLLIGTEAIPSEYLTLL